MTATRKSNLTWKGTPRINQQHPELKGLTGGEYHLRYIRKQRLHERAERIRTDYETLQTQMAGRSTNLPRRQAAGL